MGEGYPPFHWGNGLGRGCAFLYFFLLKIPYFDASWDVYFLNHTLMGGVLTPITPSSVRHCPHVRVYKCGRERYMYVHFPKVLKY